MDQKKTIKSIAAAVTLLGLSAVLFIWTYPYVRDFTLHPESHRRFADWIESLGLWGPLAVLAIQVIQVVIAFLPGEPVEVLAGMVCGAWGGLFICLVGVLIGSSIVLFLVRRFGKPLVNLFYSDEQLYKYRFMQDEKRLERIVFLVFFIPGTPKDILTYITGLTRINAARFLLISTLARIPSIATSTLAGDALSGGNFFVMTGFLIAAGVLALIGLRLHSRWADRMNKEVDAGDISAESPSSPALPDTGCEVTGPDIPPVLQGDDCSEKSES